MKPKPDWTKRILLLCIALCVGVMVAVGASLVNYQLTAAAAIATQLQEERAKAEAEAANTYRITVWSDGKAVRTGDTKGRPNFQGGYASWVDAATGDRLDATGTITYERVCELKEGP